MRNLGEIQEKKLKLKQKIDIKEKEIFESGERLFDPIVELTDNNGSIKNKISFGINAFKWFMTGRKIWNLAGGFRQAKKKRPIKKKRMPKQLRGINSIIKLISKFAR